MGFGHAYGYIVSLHSQYISCARPGLADPKGPRLRLSNPSLSRSHTQKQPLRVVFGARGERGIRTLEELSPLTVFKTAAFNHSAISPDM
jgi:hypothetical protein